MAGKAAALEVPEVVERVLGEGTFSVEKFVENFGVLVEAAGGTAKLRQMALDLAIRGVLLPQTKGVDSATTLAQSFLPRAVLHEAPDTDFPFAIPTAWTWCFLGNLCTDVHYGYTASARPDLRKTRLLRITDIQNDRVDWDSVPGCEIDPAKVPQYVLHHGDLLIARTGGTIGKTYLVQNPTVQAVFASYLIRAAPLSPDISAYLKLFAGTSFYWRQLYAGAAGTGQPNVNASTLKALLLPLPPLAEQKRIVARADQLMALIDQLEAKQNRKRDLGSRFTQASLAALTTAESPQDFTTAWTRIQENWPTLLDSVEKVAAIRGAIRNMALRGVLTNQDPDDVRASDLLQRIAAERSRRVRAKEIRRADPLPTIDEGEATFPVPSSWAWSRLGDLCMSVADGPHFSPKYVNREAGVPFLSGRNIRLDGFELDSVKFVSVQDHKTFCERVKPEPGDVLYTKGGTTGIARVNDLDFEFSVWVHVAVMKLDQKNVYPRYVALALNSPHCYGQSQKLTHGIGNRDLGLTRMIMITVPLPPLAEQKRIVAKVEHLMKLCDTLEAALRRSEDRAAKLAEAVVQEMVA